MTLNCYHDIGTGMNIILIHHNSMSNYECVINSLL